MPGDDGEWARGLLVTSPPPSYIVRVYGGEGGEGHGLIRLVKKTTNDAPVATSVQALRVFFSFSPLPQPP